jgi:hypothetical protein
MCHTGRVLRVIYSGYSNHECETVVVELKFDVCYIPGSSFGPISRSRGLLACGEGIEGMGFKVVGRSGRGTRLFKRSGWSGTTSDTASPVRVSGPCGCCRAPHSYGSAQTPLTGCSACVVHRQNGTVIPRIHFKSKSNRVR